MAFTKDELIAERSRRQAAAQATPPLVAAQPAVNAPTQQQSPVQQQQAPIAQQPVGFSREQLIAERDKRQVVETDQLFQQLGGEVPLSPELQRRATTPTVGQLRQTSGDVQGRSQAFNKLIEKGFTREQISATLAVGKGLDPVKIGRPVGGLLGGLGAIALAGRLIPGPFDDAAMLAALIASAGAGVGGVAGEAAQVAIQEKRIISGREALSAFANEAAAEGGGRAFTFSAKSLFALSPLAKQTVPEAAALVDDFAKFGGTFSPTELDKRFSLRIGESFARGSFGAKQIFQEFEERQGSAVKAFADNIVEAIGQGVSRETPERLSSVFIESTKRGIGDDPTGFVRQMLDEVITPLYKRVDDLALEEAQQRFIQVKTGGPAIRSAGGQFQAARELKAIKIKPAVSTAGIKKFAKEELAKDAKVQHLSDAGRSKLKQILFGTKDTPPLPDNLTFSLMRDKRSAFLKDMRKFGRELDPGEAVMTKLEALADAAIFDPKTTNNLSGNALNLLLNTNSLYKASKEGLKTTFAESLTKQLLKNPNTVIKQLLPNDNPAAIRRLRQSLIDPLAGPIEKGGRIIGVAKSGRPSAEGKALWNQLRQRWLMEVIEESTKDGVANPKTFNRLFRAMGDDALKEMFPDDIGKVRKLQSLFEIAGKSPDSGMSLFSRGTQALGIKKMYDAGAGDFIGFTAGGLMAIGPLAFAKMATSDKGIKILTAGFNMKPGAKGLVSNAIRSIRLLRDINKKEAGQRLKFERQKKRASKEASANLEAERTRQRIKQSGSPIQQFFTR